ncbi:MAG: hypothetical protein ACRYFU_18185 [Janthinobacterium lividum]
MRSDWGGSNGRNGRMGGGNGSSGRGGGQGNSGRAGNVGGPGNAGSQSSGNPREGGRWSNELDAIFERAPKEVAAVNKDDERNFFEERAEIKPHSLTCPNCSVTADYALTWLVRRKREHPTGFADDATRARFEKARSYMVRRDDQVACTNVRCRKRFEIAGVQSVAFLQDAAEGSVEDRAARIRAAFTGRSRG